MKSFVLLIFLSIGLMAGDCYIAVKPVYGFLNYNKVSKDKAEIEKSLKVGIAKEFQPSTKLCVTATSFANYRTRYRAPDNNEYWISDQINGLVKIQ